MTRQEREEFARQLLKLFDENEALNNELADVKAKLARLQPGSIANIPNNNELEFEAGYDSTRSNVW